MLALMLFLAAARALTLPRLDPQRMVASWAEAQELLGLNRTAAENRELVLGFYNMSRGYGHYRHERYDKNTNHPSEDNSTNNALSAHRDPTDPANTTNTKHPPTNQQTKNLTHTTQQQGASPEGMRMQTRQVLRPPRAMPWPAP